MKLTKDEWVLTGNQMKNLTANVNKMYEFENKDRIVNPTINIEVGSIAQDTFKDFKNFIKVEVPKVLNDMMMKNAIRAR